MHIIPVIDIKAGQAVRAQKGNRQAYQPLDTALCASSNVHKVIEAYLKLWPFSHFYIADLDRLMVNGNNDALINQLFNQYPHIRFMIDSGPLHLNYRPTHSQQYRAIIGTESISRRSDLLELRQRAPDYILSLDFDGQQQAMGHQDLYEAADLWPQSLIIMTLNRVGAYQGPDFTKLGDYCQRYPTHPFIAAGGIRHPQDLQQLSELGIQQALVASALHDGHIDQQALRALTTNNPV